MTTFTFTVSVECETPEQAAQVVAERLGHDEDYGFDYEIGYSIVEDVTSGSGYSRYDHKAIDPATIRNIQPPREEQ